MPTLDWIGKKAVLNHHREVPYRIMTEDSTLSYGQKDSGNLIVEGDNLEALRTLLPYYKGKIKCIYIDPPYNTGNESWIYNDNVNSPEIKKWLGKVVGKEMEDLSRHDKWLCMMYPRLQLLREFLSDDGVIFISIDDNEIANLQFLLNEIFSNKNFIAHITVKANPRGRQASTEGIAVVHDHLLVYSLKSDKVKLNGFAVSEEYEKEFNKIDSDGSKWRELGLRQRGADSLKENRPDMYFPIFVNPDDGSISLKYSEQFTTEVLPKKSDGRDGRWAWSPEKVNKDRNLLYGRLVKKKGHNEKVYDIFYKDYFNRVDGRTQKAPTIFDYKDVNTELGGKVIKELFGYNPFQYPKPVGLLRRILELGTDKDSIILDSFAGSGTTAQAVLELNKEDGGNRKFVCVEMLPEIAENITSKRVQKVIDNLEIKDSEGFKFVRLGEQMFSADGDINPKIGYVDLARHVFFMATGTPLDSAKTEFDSPLVGVSNDVAIYLLYNGILKDSSVQGGNRLTQKVLATLPKHNGVKIIYGTACGLSESVLRKNNIVFRQIPYTIFDR